MTRLVIHFFLYIILLLYHYNLLSTHITIFIQRVLTSKSHNQEKKYIPLGINRESRAMLDKSLVVTGTTVLLAITSFQLYAILHTFWLLDFSAICFVRLFLSLSLVWFFLLSDKGIIITLMLVRAVIVFITVLGSIPAITKIKKQWK
jgi:hypothetical protein